MAFSALRTQRLGESPFGRYQAVAKIGQGGMGQVFLARAEGEAGFAHLFALKLLPTGTEEQPLVRSILHEAQIACRIQHRNVVAILDVGHGPEGHYLVMEYVEGCALSELQRRHPNERPARLLLPIMIDALYGLHATHSVRGDDGAQVHLIHRDVSPQNLLIGIDGACRVTDFGIARVKNAAVRTRTGVIKGKLAYMSPEQVSGAEMDHRSDLFSAGVVLWNALTGRKLFHAPAEHVTMFHVLKRKIPKASTVGLRPPECLDRVLAKALERDPNKRFQSAEEMAIALREVALREGLFGSPTDIASWVGAAVGDELVARRRTVREASEQGLIARIDSASDESIDMPIEDLSLGSDEREVGDEMLPSVDLTRPMDRPAPKRRARALVAFAASSLLLAGVWFLAVDRPPSKAPAHAPAAARAPAPAAPPPHASVALDPIRVAVEPEGRSNPDPVRAADPPRRVRQKASRRIAPREAAPPAPPPPAAPTKAEDAKVEEENPYLWN